MALASAQINVALGELKVLMEDPELPNRCRATAEALFSLETGTEMYRNIYATLIAETTGSAKTS